MNWIVEKGKSLLEKWSRCAPSLLYY